MSYSMTCSSPVIAAILSGKILGGKFGGLKIRHAAHATSVMPENNRNRRTICRNRLSSMR